ncbi:conserved exported hypothetical protein [Paraburkholderia sacchari]|uniref:hypothetical protein n=1 Tax=Paraburkholderia sacchari TaxID=159450 RepID=UPI0039A50A5C
MKMIGFFLFYLAFVSFPANAAVNVRPFSPAHGMKAVVAVDGQVLTWVINYGHGDNRDRVVIDTEKNVHIDVDDYDFSGRLGFAVWHVDDGMGTYSVYRVFTFSPSTKKFVERVPAPQCGDEFVNLRIDKKRHRLLSAFWDGNIPKVCITRLSPLK